MKKTLLLPLVVKYWQFCHQLFKIKATMHYGNLLNLKIHHNQILQRQFLLSFRVNSIMNVS